MITESLLGTALGAVRPAVVTLFLPFGADASTGRFFVFRLAWALHYVCTLFWPLCLKTLHILR